MELRCHVQNYEWGKLGLTSKVATLVKCANIDYEINESTPYAELWMGTHPSGPSRLKSTGTSLLSFLQQHPEHLGDKAARNKFGTDLPYLFKVLSVDKALSIQAHPTKQHAEALHAARPEIYKDPNHKPELAIALTRFEALCGFRPISEIKSFLSEIKELRSVVGEEKAANLETSDDPVAALRLCFKSLMTCPQDLLAKELDSLKSSFETASEEVREECCASLFERLLSDFPGDVGCFVVFFLNYIILGPYQAIYLGPDDPHAYLYGDCVECMACSDNVVRAGLTPKFKDVETLCSMLNYEGKPGMDKIFEPADESPYSQIFRPPVPDFAVVKHEVPASDKGFILPGRLSASIVLVIEGRGELGGIELKPGVVVFIPCSTEMEIMGISEDLLLFQAVANI